MDGRQYKAYIEHFNNKRYEAVTSYFTPDIIVEYSTNLASSEASPRTLHGPKEFIDSYKALHGYVREVLELRDFMADGNLLAAELYTEFHCFKDSPTTSFLPLKKGDVRIMTNWAIYNLTDDDNMKRIRIAPFRLHDPGLAKF